MHSELAFDDADLNGFVDGRLDPSRASALAESLASDPEAAGRLDAWRRQTDSLRTMFAAVLAEPVPVRLLPVAVAPGGAAAIRDPEVARPGGRIAGVLVTTSIGMALIGFALGALASVGTDGFRLASIADRVDGTPRPLPADARDLASRAVEAHRTFLDGASAERAAGETTKPARWISHRLGDGARVPDLARQGWTFLGGHIVPGRHGPAAFLVYGSGADRLGLFVSRGAASVDDGVFAADDDGPPLGVATWADGAFGYALTSDRGRDWLGRIAATLRDGTKARPRTGDEGSAPP